eukprot:scaffold12382_cov118-Isochrysis_galbana.AAC.1
MPIGQGAQVEQDLLGTATSWSAAEQGQVTTRWRTGVVRPAAAYLGFALVRCRLRRRQLVIQLHLQRYGGRQYFRHIGCLCGQLLQGCSALQRVQVCKLIEAIATGPAWPPGSPGHRSARLPSCQTPESGAHQFTEEIQHVTFTPGAVFCWPDSGVR